MSLTLRAGIATLLVTLIAAPSASAQTELDSERFFFSPERDKDSTKVSGSIVSTSFYYRESAADGAPYYAGNASPLTASPFDRLFTDLRLQLSADHLSGGNWDFRGDLRGRFNRGGARLSEDVEGSPLEGMEVPVQSGLFSKNELDAREFYVRRRGRQTDFTLGRQYAMELAATKLDGLVLRYRKNKSITYIAMLGAYPTRGSRDVREDYPKTRPDEMGNQKRILPVTGGVGVAYRFKRYYGSFGALGILPRADDEELFGGTGTLEKARVSVVANGYYRRSRQLDLYHYAVVDALSATGEGIRNLTAGVNFRPSPSLRLFAQVSLIDTETLNVHAQTKLDEPDPNAPNAVQNNIEVARLASESARLGVSSALKDGRYEVSVIGTVRRRPELQLVTRLDQEADTPGLPTVFEKQQAADVTLRLLDRRMFEAYRVGVTATRTFPIGEANVAHTTVLVVRADVATDILEGKAELNGDVAYINSDDDRPRAICALDDLTTCLGTAAASTITAGALISYRYRPDWLLIGALNLGYQRLTYADAELNAQRLPTILTAGAFLRAAYRF